VWNLAVSTLTFEKISIDEAIVKGLQDVGYTEPTPLQKSVIPVALENQDLIVKARSGMGKNGSFIIPVLQRLARSPEKKGTRALILTPEVESARKIDEMIWAIGYHAQIESAVVDMDGNEEEQTTAVKEEPPVVVANPGRLEHILSENRLVFKNIEVLVIDEAEKIEKIGIIPQVTKILERISGEPQTLFYSATFSEDIKSLAKRPVKGEAIYIGFDVFKDVEELDNVESMGLEGDKKENGCG
jgi:superfamily II DNA/RNA helicase